MTRARDVADTQDNVGGAVPPFTAGKNKIINGDFGIWQRGTSFTPGLGTFTADRFNLYTEGSGTTRTVSQQTFTTGAAPVAGYESRFFLRYAQTVGPSGAIGNNLIRQYVEDVRTLAGQTVTFSFWAKAASTITLDAISLYQVFGTGGSPSANVNTVLATSVSISTSWTRYSYTTTLPSISGKTLGTNNDHYLEPRINLPVGSGATFTFDTWGWQLEAGSVATPFTTATGTIQGELAACQRYYQRITTGSTYGAIAVGYVGSTTQFNSLFILPVTMRVAPSGTLDAANVEYVDYSNGSGVLSAGGISPSETTTQTVRVNWTISGGTAGRGGFVRANNNTAAFVGFSSEL